MDQETVKQYARRQNDIVESLNNIIEQCNEFEEKLSMFRVETIKQITNNIEVLYQYHLMNARLMLNKQDVPKTISINDKTIEWKTSQKEFIIYIHEYIYSFFLCSKTGKHQQYLTDN